MGDTTFPTAIDSFQQTEDTHLQIPRMQAAIVALETKVGIGQKVGTDITATGNVAIGNGQSYEIGALAGSIVLTFVTTGATDGDEITLIRTGTTAHTVTCNNGGAGAGTMCILPASQTGSAVFQYMNANWRLKSVTGFPLYDVGGAITVTAAADGFTVAGGTASRTLTVTGGNCTATCAVGGIALNLNGNITTNAALAINNGACTIASAAAGSTLTMADDVEFSGAFKPTFASSADATFTLPGVSCTLGIGTALAPVVACPVRAGNDYIPLDIENGKTYVLGDATGAGSTVTLPAAAADGTRAYWLLDGVLNGHTVQFRDATGPTNITAAFTASKRVSVMITKLAGKWYAQGYESP